jgi:hypothetical protein
MAKIDHPNIGNVAKTQYLTGTITEITADDTASVSVSGVGPLTGVPIFYHCSPDAIEALNGSLEGGSGAFAEEDQVIVQKKDGKYKIIGHTDGVKRPCGVDWQIRFFKNGVLQTAAQLTAFSVINSIWIRDAGYDPDATLLQDEYQVEFDEDGNFLGYFDYLTVNPFGKPDKSDGRYDPITHIFSFASRPVGWTPRNPETATRTYWLGSNALFLFYPDQTAGGDDFSVGDIVVPGKAPGPVFDFLLTL